MKKAQRAVGRPRCPTCGRYVSIDDAFGHLMIHFRKWWTGTSELAQARKRDASGPANV